MSWELFGLLFIVWSGWNLLRETRRPWWRWRGLWIVNVAVGVLIVVKGWGG